MRTEHPLTRSLGACVGGWRIEAGRKQAGDAAVSCEGPECDSAGKGRSPGSALTPAGLSHSWAQVFQPQSLCGYLRPGYFFLNLFCAGFFSQVGSESRRKPEQEPFVSPSVRYLETRDCRAERFVSSSQISQHLGSPSDPKLRWPRHGSRQN